MLTLNINPICKASGIAHTYAWLTGKGFSHNVAHTIMSGKYRRPTLDMIEILCLLLNCVPHDILFWTPHKDADPNTALAALIPKEEKAFDWVQDMDKLSPDTLRALGERLKEIQGKK
jgi:hypothetical protein